MITGFIQAHSDNYTKGRKKIEFIVIHHTANNGDLAVSNAKVFARQKMGKSGASAHYFVDENEVWQSVLDKDKAYSVGGGTYANTKHPFYGICTNENSLSIEMCSEKDSNGNYYLTEATVKRTVDLVVAKMKEYNIPIEKVIRHYDVVGKPCPATMVDEKAWGAFKARLKDEVDEVVKEVTMLIDGKMVTVNAINVDGSNFVKLKDLSGVLEIGYDSSKRLPVINRK